MEIDQTANETLQKAAGSVFGSLAAKAHTLLSNFESEISIMTRSLIETELSKLSLKLAHFQEMEQLLESEMRHVESERIKIYAERMALKNGVRINTLGTLAKANGDVAIPEDSSLVLLQH